jgi:hypothetical protein
MKSNNRKPTPTWEYIGIAGCLLIAGWGCTSPLWAGDRDHVGGAASPAARSPGESPSGNPTNYSLRTPHVTTFSEWLGSLLEPRSGINPGTVYNGTAGDSMHSGPGIGSWGNGGGTGPGARGY